MLDIGARDENALIAGEAAGFADIEEALDLLIDAADRLHLAQVVDRACHRKVLLEWRLRESRQKRVELGRGRAIAVDAAVGLLEDEGRRKRQRHVLGIAARYEAPKDHHALRVQWAAELDLALDVGDAALPHPYPRRDAARPAEGERAELQHGQRIDLADSGAGRIDHDDVSVDDLLRPVPHAVRALD